VFASPVFANQQTRSSLRETPATRTQPPTTYTRTPLEPPPSSADSALVANSN
jgi:hypothetical protein